MAEDILNKIRKLLTLATNAATTEEESRTVAMKAVRLIVEHKIVLTTNGARPSARHPPPPPSTPPRDDVDYEEEFGDIFGRRAKRDPGRYDSYVPPPKVPGEKWVRISAAYDGRCMVCKKAFPAGTTIFWGKDVGSSHVECGQHL